MQDGPLYRTCGRCSRLRRPSAVLLTPPAPRSRGARAGTISRLRRINKIRMNITIQTTRINLQKAKEDAREKYGTDDPGKLSAKLDESRAENENKIAKFAKDLGMVEENLISIDEQAKTAGDND